MLHISLIALVASVALAVVIGRWTSVAIPVVVGAIAVHLFNNDGWHGAGWGTAAWRSTSL